MVGYRRICEDKSRAPVFGQVPCSYLWGAHNGHWEAPQRLFRFLDVLTYHQAAKGSFWGFLRAFACVSPEGVFRPCLREKITFFGGLKKRVGYAIIKPPKIGKNVLIINAPLRS